MNKPVSTDNPIDYQDRRKRLQAKLRRKKIDCLLVSRPENRRYLSGYRAPDHGINESSGVLFVPAQGHVQLLTDFRFQLQAEQETSLIVNLYQKGLLNLLDSLIAEHSIRKFGFESHYTLHSFSLKLSELAEKREVEMIPLTGLVEKQRLIKSAKEIELIRESVMLNESVFQQIHAKLSPDMSEIEIATAIEAQMRQVGAEGPSFGTIVASGTNGALPHAVPSERIVGNNSGVTIDMGLVLNGYCSDMTRNFVIGTPDETYTRIHRIVRKAQLAGIAAVKPGALMKDVDLAARKIIGDQGHAKHFGHSLGHGVGLAVHEPPSVSFRSRQALKPGMIITIEPGIYVPDWGGVRLENMVVVTENGCEQLNSDTTWLDI